MRIRLANVVCLVSASFYLSGCGSGAFQNPTNAQLMGKMMGGQQPIGGATLQLYAVNLSTLGGASTALLGTATTSDGSGTANSNANAANANNTLPVGYFNITGQYSCGSLPDVNTPVYLVGKGGNPGLSAGTNNTANSEMVALGPCSQLSSSTNVNMDEVTTVGSVAALYPYMTSLSAIGASSANASWLASAFSQANVYMNPGSGTAPGPALPSGYYASTKEVNTLSDALATCVNSSGGSAPNGVSDGSLCGNLFAASAPSNSNVATEVTGAANLIEKNPTNNVASIFNLVGTAPPFQPVLATVPPSWALSILPYPQAPVASPAAGSYAGAQSVTLTTVTPNATIYYTTDGTTPTTGSNIYTGAIAENGGTLKAIAVNRAGTSPTASSVYTVTGSVPAPSISLASGTYSTPQVFTVNDIAADASIYVTTDGTTPTTSSTRVTGSLQLTASETLRAIAAAGSLQSSVSSATYTYTPNSQIINTFAGGGSNGDNVAAVKASLFNPYSVAVDQAGNLYIADISNNRIRKVDAGTGTITTVAGNGSAGYSGDGGLAISAAINQPYGVAVDASGNLYIADTSNQRVRKVTASTGIIMTLAGTGTGGFSGDGGAAASAQVKAPYGVAVDSGGNLYIADYGNNRIREVAASTGIITTVAGNGTSGYVASQDGGPATSAELASPYAVAVDFSGNLYIADNGNKRIRKVSAATGIITTAAGTGTATFSGDNGPATSAGLNFPRGVAVDASGNLYIADYGNQRVREVSIATGTITTVAGTGTAGYSGDGGAAASAALYNPFNIAVDTSGDLFIADSGNARIREIAANTGNIATVAGNGTASYNVFQDGAAASAVALTKPYGTIVDSSGNMYIVETGTNRIRKVAAGTGLITTVAGGGANPSTCSGSTNAMGDGCSAVNAILNNPSRVAIDASGNLYITDTGNNRVRLVTASTGIMTTLAGGGSSPSTCSGSTDTVGDGCVSTAAKLNAPRGVALDGSGNLYIADSSDFRIREIVAGSGVIVTVAGNGTNTYSGDSGPATSAGFVLPFDVTLDSGGNLYIADYSSNRVREVAAGTRIVTTVAGSGSATSSGDNGAATSAGINHPAGVCVDSSGNLYIADYLSSRIRKVTASTGIIATIAGTGAGGYSGDGGAAISAQISYPYDVTLDSSGNLYIADYGNNRVRIVSH